MKKLITLIITLMVFGITKPVFAETAVFSITVTIPPHVLMTTEPQVKNADKVITQVQQVVRNSAPVIVKSIVVL